MEYQSRSQPKRIERAPPVFYISSIFRSPSDHQWTVVWVLLGQLYHHLGHRSIISCHPLNITFSIPLFRSLKFRNIGFNANLLMHRIIRIIEMCSSSSGGADVQRRNLYRVFRIVWSVVVGGCCQ